jgi:spermidine synthase
MPNTVKRWLSWLWPVPVDRAQTRNGTAEVRWEAGRLVLNSANGNQSFGSLHRVWQEVFAELHLREKPPLGVLMLGLGGGSVPRILRDELGTDAPITAVELDPAMVQLGRRYFGLDKHVQLRILEGDATVHIHSLRERFDLVLVDLFDDLDLARGVDTMGFAHALRDRCSGTLCFNTVAFDAASEERCQRVQENLRRVFGSVDELRLMGVNRVFIAR